MRNAVLVAVLVVLGPGSARADELRPRSMRATLDEATATFHVRFGLTVSGAMLGDLISVIALPSHGVIVAGVATDASGAHPLELVPARRATDALAALADRPGAGGRRWAMAVSGTNGVTSIRLAAPRAAELALELAMSAPTCFHGDHRYVSVPVAWKDILPPELRVPAARIRGLERDCAGPDVTERLWAGFPSRELAARPAGVHRIDGVASRIALGDLHIAKVELAVAGRLGEVPGDLATVILVDASRSMSPAQLEAQRELVAGYLRAAPASQVQVLAYAREVKALLPGWTPASAAAIRVDRELRGLVRRNGSNVDAAMREAAAWLARVPGTHRIVMLGDAVLANRIDANPVAALGRLVPPRTLVHTVEIAEQLTGMARFDEGRLHPLAAATRGMHVRAGLADLDATMLARPTSLDHAVLATPGWTTTALGLGACGVDGNIPMLAEGSSCRWYGHADRFDGQPLVVTGMLWGERVSRAIRLEPSRALDLARELSATRTLDPQHQRLADLAARAVNDAWSLYGEWGASGGYGDGDVTMSGTGWATTCGGCTITDIGHGKGTGTMADDPRMATALEQLIDGCRHGPHPALRAVVETTGEEIVDVAVATSDARLAACVEEALWNAWLVVPHAPARTSTVVELEARR